MKVVEYWNGTIKNYRYDGDVSAAQAHILGSVRTLYLGSKERFIHLLMRQAEEILNSARSF